MSSSRDRCVDTVTSVINSVAMMLEVATIVIGSRFGDRVQIAPPGIEYGATGAALRARSIGAVGDAVGAS